MANNSEKKYSLPNNHINIIEKKPLVDIDKLMHKDCEYILFEVPKGFDKNLFAKMTIKKFKKNGKSMKLINNYKCLCYDRNDPISRQSLIVFNENNQKRLIFKPTDRYIKIYESLELLEPNIDNIITRNLKSKNVEEKKKNKYKSNKN